MYNTFVKYKCLKKTPNRSYVVIDCFSDHVPDEYMYMYLMIFVYSL